MLFYPKLPNMNPRKIYSFYLGSYTHGIIEEATVKLLEKDNLVFIQFVSVSIQDMGQGNGYFITVLVEFHL